MKLNPSLSPRFVALCTAALGLCVAISACYPNPTEGDPIHMVWDEDPTPGFHKLQLLEHAEGLRVFWWNVAWGQYNHDGSLDQNIQELIRSEARPDVIALGEYKPMVFTDQQKTLDALRQHYPYQVYAPYQNGTGSDGVAVFSAYPFEKRVVPDLDWTPIGASDADQQAYRRDWNTRFSETASWWDRPYIKLDINFLGQHVGLVAEHLLEPWGQIYQGNGAIAFVRAMTVDADNPLGYQTRRLKSEMKADFGEHLDSMPLLLIGDFNTPKSMLGINTKCYDLLVEDMEDIFREQPASFPAKSAPDRDQEPWKTIGGLKIDHAFVSGGMKPIGAAVVPLKGSDHYPIYVIAKPGS